MKWNPNSEWFYSLGFTIHWEILLPEFHTSEWGMRVSSGTCVGLHKTENKFWFMLQGLACLLRITTEFSGPKSLNGPLSHSLREKVFQGSWIWKARLAPQVDWNGCWPRALQRLSQSTFEAPPVMLWVIQPSNSCFLSHFPSINFSGQTGEWQHNSLYHSIIIAYDSCLAENSSFSIAKALLKIKFF